MSTLVFDTYASVKGIDASRYAGKAGRGAARSQATLIDERLATKQDL